MAEVYWNSSAMLAKVKFALIFPLSAILAEVYWFWPSKSYTTRPSCRGKFSLMLHPTIRIFHVLLLKTYMSLKTNSGLIFFIWSKTHTCIFVCMCFSTIERCYTDRAKWRTRIGWISCSLRSKLSAQSVYTHFW